MISRFLASLITVYIVLIFVRVLTSWFENDFSRKIRDTVEPLTDPYLKLVSRFIPPFGPVDFSPTIAVIILWVIQSFIASASF